MLHVDHVIWATPDPEATAAQLHREHGLASVAGGRHPAWGTANRIVPLGGAYLELMTVFDEELASTSLLGRSVQARLSSGEGFLGWMVAGPGFDERVAANHLEAPRFGRERPDGTEVTWRLAGLDAMLAEPPLPGLIAWDDPDAFPGLTPVEHAVKPRGIAWVEVAGDASRLREWLGDAELGLAFAGGEPGLRAAGIALDGGGEIVLRSG